MVANLMQGFDHESGGRSRCLTAVYAISVPDEGGGQHHGFLGRRT